jgi:hypothetical protein
MKDGGGVLFATDVKQHGDEETLATTLKRRDNKGNGDSDKDKAKDESKRV